MAINEWSGKIQDIRAEQPVGIQTGQMWYCLNNTEVSSLYHFSLVTGMGVLHHGHVFMGIYRVTCVKLLLKQVEIYQKKRVKGFSLMSARSNSCKRKTWLTELLCIEREEGPFHFSEQQVLLFSCALHIAACMSVPDVLSCYGLRLHSATSESVITPVWALGQLFSVQVLDC